MPHRKFHIPLRNGDTLEQYLNKDMHKIIENFKNAPPGRFVFLPQKPNWNVNKGYYTFMRFPWPLERAERLNDEDVNTFR